MRTISLASLLLVGFGLAAQSYIPLLDPSATWQDENATGSPGPSTGNHECMRYFLDGDTLVNDTSYKILRQTGRISYSNYTTGENLTNWFDGQLTALLREDTSTRHVYIRPIGSPMEFLFYDFSADVGPYPPTYRFGLLPGVVVTSVDTVLLSDGPHRRINFSEYEWIIEGVGSIDGFLESGVSGEIHWLGHLVCHTLDTSPNYIVNSFDCECGSNVGVPDPASSTLRISPSPTSGLCRLDGAPPNAPFLIRSMDGRTVRSGTCSTSGSTSIDMSDLPAAMYFLEVVEANRSSKAKIIKE